MEVSAHKRCHPMLIPAFPCQSSGKLTFNPPSLLCRGKHRAAFPLKILFRAKKELSSVGKCRHRCLGFGAAEAAPGGCCGRGRRCRGSPRLQVGVYSPPPRLENSPNSLSGCCICACHPHSLVLDTARERRRKEEREKQEEEEGEEYFRQTLRSANSRLYSPSAAGPGPPSSALPPAVDFS